MENFHRIYREDSRVLSRMDLDPVHLVVTSPPYPMIEMWDENFKQMNPDIDLAHPSQAFELMNRELDRVWEGIDSVLVDGGIICINIGNATRSLNGSFAMYPSNVRITSKFMKMGYTVLPEIIWRKHSTSPTKFMGSGMLPPNAYVTQEHEYILIFRKGGMRKTLRGKSDIRRSSAYFWDERNKWFSDLWTLKGIKQKLLNNVRGRSAAYPFELPYRLIQMFSIKGDVILDPFLGTGTSTLAAIAGARSSIGVEYSSELVSLTIERITSSVEELRKIGTKRLTLQNELMAERQSKGKVAKYMNEYHNIPVVTSQESDLHIEELKEVSIVQEENPAIIKASYV